MSLTRRGPTILLVIIVFGILAVLMVRPWDGDEAVLAALMSISLVTALIWASIYIGFKVKINKTLAELGFVIAIPILILLARSLAKIIGPLWRKKPEKRKRQNWWTGSIFDVLKLRLKPLEVVVGVQWNKPIRVSLSKHHTMIGGSTDQGKTVLLNSIIGQLLLSDVPLKIWIFDLKGAKEDAMRLWSPLARYICDVEPAIEALGELIELMKVRSREGWEKELIVIIDELVELTSDMVPEYRRHAINMMATLARMSRSGGIRIIAATQHPRYSDVPKIIAHNLMRKICLGVAAESQAQVILEVTGQIPVPLPERQGDFILREGKDFRVGRTILIQPDDIREIVARCMAGKSEDDIRLRILQRVATGVQVGDRIKGLNAVAESLSVDSDLLKVIYRNFALAGAFELGGENPQSGYRLAVEPLVAMGLVRRYIEEGKWDDRLESLWNGNG